MKRKLLISGIIFVLSLCVMLCCNATTKDENEEIEEVELKFELNEDGNSYKVTGFVGAEETEVIVPETYNGLTVTEIGDEAFYRVYADYNLEKIVLPETIIKIGNGAFDNCQKLVSLNIPSSVTSIGYNAFCNCKVLNNVVLPSNLTVIEEGTFYNCETLEEIIIPDTVTEIKSQAFSGCSSLVEIVIPDSVTRLGLTYEHWKEGGLFSACTSLKKITLSKNIKKINHNSFASCTSLEELVIPEGVEEIEGCSLFRCTNLKKLVLPKSFVQLNEGLENCEINPTIYGYVGSYAEEIAKTYGYEFVPLEELTTVETKDVTINDEPIQVMPIDKDSEIQKFINEENFPVVNTYTITVYDATGNEKSETEKIGSKNVIKITNSAGDILAEYMVIVFGDITGNGEVKMYDAFTILKDSLFNGKLDEIETLIRDFNNDGEVKMYDAFSFLKEALFN